MGGRGSNSMERIGGNQAAEVTFDGETTEYYFSTYKGTNYVQRTISGTPEPTPNNMTAKEFLERAQKNGAKVRKISAKEKAAKEKAHKKDREEADRFLNQQSASDRTMAKGSRESRRARNAVLRRR